MNFILGFFAGIGMATLIFVILAFFRAGIEQRVKIIEKQIGNAGPKQKGGIFLPEDEADIARKEHIEENQKAGKDTPFEELR